LKNKIKSIIPNGVLLVAFLLKVLSDKLSIVAVKLHMAFKTDLGLAALEAEKGMKHLIAQMKAKQEEIMAEQAKQQATIKNSQNVFVLDPSKKQKD